MNRKTTVILAGICLTIFLFLHLRTATPQTPVIHDVQFDPESDLKHSTRHMFDECMDEYYSIQERQKRDITVSNEELDDSGAKLLNLKKTIDQIGINMVLPAHQTDLQGLQQSVDKMVELEFSGPPAPDLNAVDRFYDHIPVSNPLEKNYAEVAAKEAELAALSNHLAQLEAMQKPFDEAYNQAKLHLSNLGW